MQRLKQYQHAAGLYRSALDYDKDEPRSLCYLGETHILMGEIDKGLLHLKQGVQAAGSKPEHQDVVKRAKVLLQQFGGK
jgi:hypothetical protein